MYEGQYEDLFRNKVCRFCAHFDPPSWECRKSARPEKINNPRDYWCREGEWEIMEYRDGVLCPV